MTVPSSQTPKLDTYYPSCLVNLVIRYDTAFTLTPSGVLALNVGTPTQQVVAETISNQFAAAGFVSAAASTGVPLFQEPLGNDGNSYAFLRIPKSASIELPAYRQAGKFSLTFDYKDLPIDPRLIRSVGVSIFLDTVTSENFAKGITSVDNNDRTRSLLKPSIENLALRGVVDNWSVRHSNNGSEVTMEGRDQRAILLDAKINPDSLELIEASLKSPIDVVIRTIIKTHPLLGNIDVFAGDFLFRETTATTSTTYYADWPDGIIPSPAALNNETSPLNQLAPARKRTRVRRGADGKKAKASPKASLDVVSYWDLIVNYCALVGAVAYFEGSNTLRIKPTNTLFDQIGEKPAIGAFNRGRATRNVGEEKPLKIRRMVFGQNAEEITYERKYSGVKAQTVQTYSLDTSSTNKGEQKLLIAEYPTELEFNQAAAKMYKKVGTDLDKALTSTESPSGQVGVKKDVLRFPVRGVSDIKTLRFIAYTIYEELMRGEQGGSIKTRSLASFGGNNSDPDLLYLRPGDAVELLTDGRALSNRAPLVSTLNAQQQGINDGKLLKDLTRTLGDPNHAIAVVASLKKYVAELQDVYRVSNVKFDWSITSGITVAFDFQNYIIPRQQVNDLPLPLQAEPNLRPATPSPTVGVNTSGNAPTPRVS